MSLNIRVLKLEKRVDEMESTLSKMDEKLDTILSISTAAKHTGNFLVDNLPRIIGGVIAGLTGVGVVAAGQSQNISTLFGV